MNWQAQVQSQTFQNSVDNFARTPLSKVVLFLVFVTVIRMAIMLPRLRHTDGYKHSIFADMIDALIFAGGVVFLLVRPFLIQTFYIPSGSMRATLEVNDFIIANKMIYRTRGPEVGEIVVFHPPDRAFDPREKHEDFIKRCIGGPGDVVEIREGLTYLNGRLEKEPYVTRGRPDFDFRLVNDNGKFIPLSIFGERCNYRPELTSPEYFADFGDDGRQNYLLSLPPAPIPPGYYLMLGDNRNQSADSRKWGLVPRRDVIGRAEMVFLPLGRMKLVGK